MARRRTTKKTGNETSKAETRRGSPEAIAMRQAARKLNYIFEKGATVIAMDGRTLKRKRRLMQELQEGKRGEPLKAHEVLGHATELMQLLGENLSSLRALKPKLPARPPLTNEFLDAVRQTQSSYNYDPRAWALLGINIERVMQGASGEEASEGTPARRRGRRRKAA